MLRKLVFFITPLLIITLLFLIIVFIFNREGGKGALQVTSVPDSQVYLDNKLVGKTPLCLCNYDQLIKTGEYDLKLVPLNKELGQFNQKININKEVLTVVDRTFDKRSTANSGSLITLTPLSDKDKAEILIVSFPSGAEVILNNNPKGTTPISLKDVPISDHEIKIVKEGYKEKILKLKTVAGSKLEAIINLGINPDLSPELNESSASASLIKKVKILDTPTGFLRVRETDSVNSAEIATVSPGEILDFVSEKENWYQVRLADGKIGWISATYALKE
jgi:hypothetical protein